VVELFAGVGGFRIGLEGRPGQERPGFKVIWANQWEPKYRAQNAAEIYANRWGLERSEEDPEVYSNGPDDVLVNKDIATIDASDVPDHDLLCGGFPCQDYSVAKTLSAAEGISGKKGVLWWEIRRIIEAKMPRYVLLENVDRLLKSPKGQRGRDFAVMLASLDELGYAVEWLELSASDFGFPQRRKRVFIMAYGPGTEMAERLAENHPHADDESLLLDKFPHTLLMPYLFPLRPNGSSLSDVSEKFNDDDHKIPLPPRATSPFQDFGTMVGGHVITSDAIPNSPDRNTGKLREVLQTPSRIDDSFIIDPDDLTRWGYLKGSKNEDRTTPSGFTYRYSEGPVTFPDALDRPSRTIVTGEGGSGPSRFKHVVAFRPTKRQRESLGLDSEEARKARELVGIPESQWLRRLMPVELERLNGFPDGHTEGASDSQRAFFMGNALVCGIVKGIGEGILEND